MSALWTSFKLSLQIASLATVLTAAVGVPLAFWMSRVTFRGKSALESLIMVPLVLPPTVVGYGILVVLGGQGWLAKAWGYSIVFKKEGAVLAAAVVAIPMLYMPAKAAFLGIDRDLEDMARSIGATRWQTFWRVSLPLARRGILSGLVLAFARALGEFGATVMVFGWQEGRMTLPISIYGDFEAEELSHAWPAVGALVAISLVLIAGYNRIARSGRVD